MNGPVLVAYATKAGSTRVVADAVARTLREHGLEADLRPAEEVGTLAPYGAVVLGAAIHGGRMHKDARRFLRHHRAQLAECPLAMFAMGRRARLDHALAAYPDLRLATVANMPAADTPDWDAIREWADEVVAILTPVLA